MGCTTLLFLSLLLLGVFIQGTHQISRDDFPSDFVFGAGTSALQVEGAAEEDGRSPSIWDTYVHSGKMPDKSNFDIAADQYHRYKEDVKLMSDMGLDAYRFSISWSRLLPEGRGAINPKGLHYYNNLINELISYGIEPHGTLHHLDIPQVLEDEYKGWLSPKIVKDFAAYADVCFREFGDRVKYWSTLNEPNIVSFGAYDQGLLPPERCSSQHGIHNCTAGNSSVEPYIATHNQLLAHAEAARLYKKKYQAKQGGWIGISIYAFWMTPQTNKSEDVAAAQRALDFMLGWFFNPLVFGDYPEIMKKNAGSRLPSFTKSQSELVKGSFDFIGLNYYTTIVIADKPRTQDDDDSRDFMGDMFVTFVQENRSSSGISPFAIPTTPWALEKMLEYIQRTYGNPPIYIHENGKGTDPNVTLNDTARVDCLNSSLESLLKAVRSGSNTKGYFVWSFLDVFELLFGYQFKYGLIGVDFTDKGLPRYPKYSAYWYANFLKKGMKIQKLDASAAYQSAQ